MFEIDREETVSKAVTSIWHGNNIEKSTWKTDRYFGDFESRFHVEISTLKRCHNFDVDSHFKISETQWTFPMEFRRWIYGESIKMCPLGVKWKLSVESHFIPGLLVFEELRSHYKTQTIHRVWIMQNFILWDYYWEN